MARPSWIEQIRYATAPAEQVVALRGLKNELVGHPLKKEMAVTLGALDPIVQLSSNRPISRNGSKAHDYTFAQRSLAEAEQVRLQGLQVLASLALGGPAFLAPLQSAAAFPAILSNLCPARNPSQLVLASLRALSNMADSAALSKGHNIDTSIIAEALFVRQHLKSLQRILSQSSPSITSQCQISIASSLISRLCHEERHQQALAYSGILDALATNLASFVVADGLMIPGADVLAQRDGLEEYVPKPAPPNAKFSTILEAIAVIITDSKFRASQFLYSPAILAIFPTAQPTDFIVNQSTRSAWNAFSAAGLSARQDQLNAVDYLLPCIPHQGNRSAGQGSAFPPLGSPGSRENLAQFGRKYNIPSSWAEPPNLDSALAPTDDLPSESEEPESPLIAYLILLFRSRTGMERLMAASILTVLYRAGLTHMSRETVIGLLVVPVLVHMLDDIVLPPSNKDGQAEDEATTLDRAIKERAPAVLAMLITDSEYLQNAAFNSNLVSKLSKMLKVSYDTAPKAGMPQGWSPYEERPEQIAGPPSSQLGQEGQSPLMSHKIKVREGALKAIAALVPFKDEYRKAIVDQGMIPYIVESMNSNPRKPTPRVGDKSDTAGKVSDEEEEESFQYGTNPIPVLIAACGAVRALSRSVTILRTTLIDNGVAMPVFNLLQHPDLEVQIAATATVCNLVTDVSPMREEIAEAGVLKILCEHAHSANAKLRLNAVWALKHFVHAVSNDLKRQCLEELGQGWLVELICSDLEDEALVHPRAGDDKATTQNGDGVDEDVDMEDDQESSAVGANTVRPSSRHNGTKSKSVQQAEARLALLRDSETNPAKKARKDDVAVQEQGLDFIRNLIGGAGQGGTTETTEMIDFLFDTLGQGKVFEILASKLRPKVVNPFGRRGWTAETRVIPPQSEIITAVGYILVHMAASVPRHRQLVIAQTELLKLLVQQFGHPSIEVRLALCYLVTNLTWRDDSNDSQACAQRASELKKLRFLTKLELLEHDPELNVRQLAKSALWQMKQSY